MDSADIRIPAERTDDVTQPEADDRSGTYPGRPARISVQSFVTLNADWGCIEARACDVSADGLKIALDTPVAPGPVTVKLPGFPIFTGEVRWRDAHHAGVRFLRPIPMEFLAIWVKMHGLAAKD